MHVYVLVATTQLGIKGRLFFNTTESNKGNTKIAAWSILYSQKSDIFIIKC